MPPSSQINLPLLVSATLSGALTILLLKRRALAAPQLARRDVSSLPAPIWLLGAMLILLAPPFGASLASALPSSITGPDKSLRQSAIQQLFAYGAAMTVGGLLLLLIRRGLFSGPSPLHIPTALPAPLAAQAHPRSPPNLSTLGFALRPADLPRALLCLLITAPFYLLVSESASWLERAIRHQPIDTIQHTTLRKLVDAFSAGSPAADKPWAWIIILSVILLVPAIEELLYRGFLQSFFIRALPGRHPLIPIALTSLVFALMHVATDVVPWSAAAALFTLSMALGLAFERTGRLGVPILMHALFNALNIAAAVWS